MEPLVLTRKEAAEYLKISLPTLDSFLHRKDRPIPHVYAGRRPLIPLEPLKEWLVKESAQQAGA